MTKKQIGEERFYLTYTSALLFITEGIRIDRVGSWKQELMQEARVGNFLLAGLFPMTYRTQNGTTHHGLGSPPLITK